MRWRFIALLAGGLLLLLSGLPAMARIANGGNCVAYARDLTGVRLDGNAAAWWPHAEGRYERGHQPSLGAILVFKPSRSMHVGHVAVISRVVSPREVLVDQANWVRGRVSKAMSVVDASPLNDWTSVKVLEPHSGKHGRENPTYGFIYPRVLPASFGEMIAEPEQTAPRHGARAAHALERTARGETVREPQKGDRGASARTVRTAQLKNHRMADKTHRAAVRATHHTVAAPAKSDPAGNEAGEARVAASTPTHRARKGKDAKFTVVY